LTGWESWGRLQQRPPGTSPTRSCPGGRFPCLAPLISDSRSSNWPSRCAWRLNASPTAPAASNRRRANSASIWRNWRNCANGSPNSSAPQAEGPAIAQDPPPRLRLRRVLELAGVREVPPHAPDHGRGTCLAGRRGSPARPRGEGTRGVRGGAFRVKTRRGPTRPQCQQAVRGSGQSFPPPWAPPTRAGSGSPYPD